jgi:hypothetical protein
VRYLICRFVTFVLVATSVVLMGCKEQVVQEPLPLLEDGNSGESTDLNTGPVADNSRCYICHINYEQEKLTSSHAKADIGCERCHGASDAHCSDKDGITPPDIMYPAEKVNPFCKSCHPNSNLSGSKKFCTDCHGEHRLGHRTRKCDKTLGELIKDDKVSMLTDEIHEQ